LFRDATLQLARDHAFARSLVNSGRLSTASTLHGSPLSTPDVDTFAGAMVPGAPALDAPLQFNGRDGWLLREAGTGTFTALLFAGADDDAQVRTLQQAAEGLAPLRVLRVAGGTSASAEADPRTVVDRAGLIAQRYDGQPGTVVLLRPDQHVCARWRRASGDAVHRALRRALALH
jgi:3-(3-hydroxy-phenyl)propionate hydroxylase